MLEKNKKYNELPEIYLKLVLNYEGGLTKNPKDTGNWYGGKLYGTNRGITIGALIKAQSEGLVAKTVTIESLTTDLDSVKKIYEVNYYIRSSCDKLPHPLAFAHFDIAVNGGIGRASKFLQTTINKFSDAKITIDGSIGNQTLSALNKVLVSTDISVFVKQYNNIREQFYIALANSKPNYKVFLKGWLNRLNSVRKFTEN